MSWLDDAVCRILRVKFRAGLFEHLRRPDRATDPGSFVTDRRRPRRHAHGCLRSMVLLQNDDSTLPLDPAEGTPPSSARWATTSTIGSGPGGVGQDETPSCCRAKDGSTGTTTYAQGCTLSNEEPPDYDPPTTAPTTGSPTRWRRAGRRPGRPRGR